jgi:hypothetical protein
MCLHSDVEVIPYSGSSNWPNDIDLEIFSACVVISNVISNVEFNREKINCIRGHSEQHFETY